MNSSWVFLVNLLSTWYLVGLIWTIQVVHYNLFDRVGEDGFVRYETDHSNLITPIVAPPMMVELATAVLLAVTSPPGLPRWIFVAGLAAVIGVWLSTFLIQVPCHSRLTQGFNEADYRLLVGSNWIRTALWTFRGLLIGYAASRLIAS